MSPDLASWPAQNFELSKALGESAWLGRRQNAFVRFQALGFPTPELEDWKYTSLGALQKSAFETPKPAALSKVDLSAWCLPQSAARLVFIDGSFAEALSTPAKMLLAGLQVLPLATPFSTVQNESLRRALQQYLGEVAHPQDNALAALNTALTRDGALLVIENNVDLEHPVEILFVTTQSGVQTAPRLLVVAENNAQATVVETHAALGAAEYFTNAVGEIVLQEGARLTHVKLGLDGAAATHAGLLQARQAKDSWFCSLSMTLGGALVRNDINTVFESQGAHAEFLGLYVGAERQHIDHHTLIDHAQPHCTSNELYKGILSGRSHGVFNGKVMVRPQAQKTSAFQSNQNLLLSPDVSIDTKPQLEIFADDVKCTHGATIGRLDDNSLFYLRARGIGKEEARRMLVHAFASDVIRHLKNDSVQRHLEALLTERLERDFRASR